MRNALQVNLSSAIKRSWLAVCAASLAVLFFGTGAFAATPVDIYQDMESGNLGNLLTPTIMNASSHGATVSWNITGGMWVSTVNHRNLPGPVIAGGVTYNGTGGTRSWIFYENNQLNRAGFYIPSGHLDVTIACYYATGVTVQYRQFDSIAVGSGSAGTWGAFEVETEEGGPTAYRLESAGPAADQTNYSSPVVITLGKPYWVNLQYKGSTGYVYGAVFDPDNGFAQVGSTMQAVSIQGAYIDQPVLFGRDDGHGNYSAITSQGEFAQIVIDYTNAAFPLLPSGSGTDTTPPSAPGTVRDGTSADLAYTTSTTQLSANWDASSDAQSGISGYQYAIGTSAGGTQTVNWTSLGNVTTVTKTGLTLTNGQTYFFSVKAVNGVGLTGSATNSNGQKVDSTGPSAPPAVRDGTGTDISTTSSTTQLSANWDASTDNESGISGYQYAIGTSAGGTQTVNWTSLGNVTTVTKTGLTLTVGQTYYFSVRAVNGAKLTGSATNSNGQTVVSGGGSVTYFQDNFESWTAHGGAWSSVNYESSTHILNTSTDYAKAGAKSLKLTDTDTTATSYGAFLTKTFSSAISGDIYVRFFVFLPTGYGSTNVGCVRRLVRIWCGSNRGQLSVNGDSPLLEEVGAWGGIQSPSALSENAWHCLEIHMAAPSASTLMEFWVDGVKNSATLNGSFSGSTTYDHIEFGDVCLAGSGANGNGTFYLDELVVSNFYNGTSVNSVTYFSDNFENWTAHGGAWSSVSGESATRTLNTSTDYAAAGTKSLKVTTTDTAGGAGAELVKNFSPTVSGDIYVRFYVYLTTGFFSTNNFTTVVACKTANGNSANFVFQRSGNKAMLVLSTSVQMSSFPEATWSCIEFHVQPSTNSLMEVWVNGTSIGSASSGVDLSTTTWNSLNCGWVNSAGGAGNGSGTIYFDELVVSNSYIGPLP